MTQMKEKKILLVDDEEFNLLSLRVILECLGIKNIKERCVYAHNGQQALDIVIKDVENNNNEFSNFDLILTDFQMPIMDGNEATLKIREFLYQKNILQPIITGITGHAEQSYIKRSIESGMNQVLSKPVDNELLKKTLKRL